MLIVIHFSTFAEVAQLAEQLIRNQQVEGSSPFLSSKLKYFVHIKTPDK
jgi:hypothetical protein